MSASSYGVHCNPHPDVGGCGLQVDISIGRLDPDEALEEGIARWNRRDECERAIHTGRLAGLKEALALARERSSASSYPNLASVVQGDVEDRIAELEANDA